MPRAVTDAPLTTRAARERLASRHQPYWRGIEAGAAIGYRKGSTGGAWLVRIADPTAGGGYRQASIARADDALKADGAEVLDYRHAEAKARDWIARHNRVAAGLEAEAKAAQPYTVADAIGGYLADYAARGGKGVPHTRIAADAHILPTLGGLPVARLTRELVRAWHRTLAATPPRVRAKGGKVRHRESQGDPEAPRRRRATANRILTILKAALNHARAEGVVTGSADAWALVKPFREADAPKVRYLQDDEATRLANGCPGDLRELVTAALLTGCRYGELAAMKAGDFDLQAGTVTIARSKGGKPRHVVLTDEGRAFFALQAAGRASGSLLFTREALVRQATKDAPAVMERRAWTKSDQSRPLRDACVAARITPALSFHILRHTYASRLAQRGAPMGVIAAQLGHADTRLTERHYAHLAPHYVADVVRATFGTLGLAPQTNVARLRKTGG